jgi:hypothetical protein
MKTLAIKKNKEQEPEVLDEATLAAIDKAQESFETGQGMTIQQVRELNRKRYQAWLKISQDPSV